MYYNSIRLLPLFQFTPLREGRHLHLETYIVHSNFNSRPSARGDAAALSPRRGDTDFNSRPSARGDDDGKIKPPAYYISIHAPPRGATKEQTNELYQQCISIHAPPRGATPSQSAHQSTSTYFNSRPSARGDFSGEDVHDFNLHFNSRPSARGDQGARSRVFWWT